MPVPFTPEVFGDFLLIQRLEESAAADVMLAVRLGDRSGRAFVLKRPPLGERASGRAAQAIAREAEVLEAVKAPGLIALAAAGQIAGLPYVATEHVRGLSLAALLGESPLPKGAARAIALDLAGALAALHRAGWVHGDVAPTNVVVDDAGETRLVDLGLARRAGPAEADPAEDIHGWGAVVARCSPRDPEAERALARDPAARPKADELAQRLRSAPVDRAALAELVERATRAARERPSTTIPALTPTAPMAGLRPAQTVHTSPPTPTLIEPEPPKSGAQRYLLRAAILLLVLVVGIILGRISTRWWRPQRARLSEAALEARHPELQKSEAL